VDVPVRLTTKIEAPFPEEEYTDPVVIEKTNHDADEMNTVVNTQSETLAVLADFCVVGLYDGKFQNTRPEFNSEYQGRQYHFASAAAKRQFDSQPELYGCTPSPANRTGKSSSKIRSVTSPATQTERPAEQQRFTVNLRPQACSGSLRSLF